MNLSIFEDFSPIIAANVGTKELVSVLEGDVARGQGGGPAQPVLCTNQLGVSTH
jgi:hypothetical protein